MERRMDRDADKEIRKLQALPAETGADDEEKIKADAMDPAPDDQSGDRRKPFEGTGRRKRRNRNHTKKG